jgi:hypothetical protein
MATRPWLRVIRAALPFFAWCRAESINRITSGTGGRKRLKTGFNRCMKSAGLKSLNSPGMPRDRREVFDRSAHDSGMNTADGWWREYTDNLT